MPYDTATMWAGTSPRRRSVWGCEWGTLSRLLNGEAGVVREHGAGAGGGPAHGERRAVPDPRPLELASLSGFRPGRADAGPQHHLDLPRASDPSGSDGRAVCRLRPRVPPRQLSGDGRTNRRCDLSAPKQRNTDDEKAAIEAGRSAAEIWPDKPAKAAQKDTQARWTVKTGRRTAARFRSATGARIRAGRRSAG